MSFRVGDSLFQSSGKPVAVVRHGHDNMQVTLSVEPSVIKDNMRHGVINGLNEADRMVFNKLMDETKQEEDPEKKVQILNKKISELQGEKKNHRLVGYLNSEVYHLMTSHGLQQKEYSVEEFRLR